MLLSLEIKIVDKYTLSNIKKLLFIPSIKEKGFVYSMFCLTDVVLHDNQFWWSLQLTIVSVCMLAYLSYFLLDPVLLHTITTYQPIDAAAGQHCYLQTRIYPCLAASHAISTVRHSLQTIIAALTQLTLKTIPACSPCYILNVKSKTIRGLR